MHFFSRFQDHIVAKIQEIKYFVRCEAFMVMTVKITILWDVVLVISWVLLACQCEISECVLLKVALKLQYTAMARVQTRV
jgi:hypothetical protein